MDTDELAEENERLRRQQARLLSELEETRSKLAEPEEVLRAIRQGEIDAVVVEEDGQEKIYALQRFDSAYRSVVEECFPYGVWLAEPDGRLHYVSPSFLELLHTDLQEMREKGQFHFLPPELRNMVEREWARCRDTGKAFNVEYTVQLGHGPERAISTHGVLSRTHNGLPRWVGVNIDVTQRHEMENRLRQQAAALREADHRKDEFLALLGHELRNPLAVIHNVVQVLSLPDLSQADLLESRLMMEKQVGHLTRLVDDLLDVSRFTHGKIQLRKEKVELATAAQHTIECVRPLVDSLGHKLTVSLPAHPVHLEADSTRLEQILQNLLNNAIKYTEPGGNISLSVDESNGEAVIRVRDDGAGIPAAFLPKMFDLFTQAEGSLDRTRGGLGIGLALVRKLVAMHGGSVEAHSEGPGRGSEFIVRLPSLPGVANQRSAPSTVLPQGGESVRVLVVDDSRDLAESLKTLLQLSGHDVQLVHDGPAALASYRTQQPDVVLLDIGLPGMNGYDVARQLRKEQAGKGPLVVAMSGYGKDEDKRLADEAGCDFHMTKPLDLNRLKALITAAFPA